MIDPKELSDDLLVLALENAVTDLQRAYFAQAVPADTEKFENQVRSIRMELAERLKKKQPEP
jgi:uncharacterized protein YbcI